MSIKALIWDLEGVLLISEERKIEATVAKNLGVSEEAIGNFFHSEFNDRVDLGEHTQEEFWLKLLDSLGLPHERLAHITDVFQRDFYIDQDLLGKIIEYRKKYKTAILSNYSDILREMLETRWRVDGAFDEIIISWEEKIIKPDPRIFHLTLQRLGVEKEEAVLIDDRIVNIKGAQKFGLHTIYFQTKDQALSDLEALLDHHS
jgi:putative hydrolase of the HAD superfamily